ncbi:MAG: RluA family pseudouridine synthase [Bacilli bacterium]|nr:RluA family pseudouridine synthase [Bacilli bacterium]
MKKIVDKTDTLLNYLTNNIDMPKKKIKEYLKYKSIYVDGVNTTKFDYPLSKGSTIYIDTKTKEKSSLPFKVIYEDNYIIVVDKPAGLLTVSTEKEKEHTLYHIVREYLKNKKENIFIIHRLDKETSGIVIFAKDEKTKNTFQESWDNIAKKRQYQAIVEGILDKKEDTLINNLKENSINIVYVAKEGKKAITKYKVIKENKKYSLLEIQIKTGRKNQIRVQLSHINHPIIGDKKYKNKKDKEQRLFLHANKLVIYNPILKKEMTFTSNSPNIFKEKMKSEK